MPAVNEDLLEDFQEGTEPVYRIYEPDSVIVVLGAGRKLEQDVFLEQAQADGVAVLRRRGGGGTVVLSPGQVVLALVAKVDSPFRNLEYSRAINHWVRDVLEQLGAFGIEDRGTGDLAIRDRKILGISLYRRRNVLFYQASLLVCNSLELFDRYLPYPSRVPDYRMNREHSEFCTTLHREGYAFSVSEVMKSLRRVVEERLSALR